MSTPMLSSSVRTSKESKRTAEGLSAFDSPLRGNTMLTKLQNYIDGFNACDEELYPQKITNAQAADFLREQIPMLDCPDKDLEKTYYFRWWTYRKHIKETDTGHVITEFLPPVKWAGPYNTINCPACFHIREGRWLKDPEGILAQYIDFWLNEQGDAYKYTSWLCHAVLEYCDAKQDYRFGIDRLPKLIAFFEKRSAIHRRSCGLYWSDDRRDGMEYSISGPGLRPTINSYVYADAQAIVKLANMCGEDEIADRFNKLTAELAKKMDTLLWHDGFYRTIPLAVGEDPVLDTRPQVPPEHTVREQIGFVPWYFDIPAGKTQVFAELLTEEGFNAPYGITTAERRHPRFMEAHSHICLWNGPVWPFATSQTLVALANVLRKGSDCPLSKEDYYGLLHQYAVCHSLTKPDGTVVPFIDENMDPFTGRWLARDLLETAGWQPKFGGYERGKDYNHSLFCDLVLSGLLGIQARGDTFTVKPLIPDSWDYFRVENLWLKGKCFTITYDKDGCHYGEGAGLRIISA